MKRLLMELIGTFFFLLTLAVTGNALATGAMLMAWIYIGASVSGGHYNPLVSLAVKLMGRLSWRETFFYWIAQILGGVAAYTVAATLLNRLAIPQPGVELFPAFIFEILLSFVFGLLVLVVVLNNKYRDNHIFGFAIGFTLFALAIVGAPISGGLFNPAIALGSNLAGLLKGMTIAWPVVAMYVGGGLLGGLLAAHAYRYFIIEK